MVAYIAGRTPPAEGDGCTLRNLVNSFLSAKQRRVESGELAQQSFADYFDACAKLIDFLGRQQRVDDLGPADFERFRTELAKQCSVTTLRNEIGRCRIVFGFAHTERLVNQPVHFGQSFSKPSAKLLREARNRAGERMFEAAELRTIIKAAEPIMQAMIYLGLNCGFGNTDIAMLPQSAVNLETGWIVFPRPKTAIMRRIPLWPETVLALKTAIAERRRRKGSLQLIDAGNRKQEIN